MKYLPLSDHKHFFEKNGFIAFEELIPKSKIELIYKTCDEILEKRSKFEKNTPFVLGRDLWRENSFIKSWVLKKELAKIASFLTSEKRLRIGYDQLLRTFDSPFIAQSFDTFRLDQASSVQGIVCGLLLSLKKNQKINAFLPEDGGSGVFFSPTQFFSLKPLWETPDQSFLLITYTKEKAVYIFQNDDPHTHALKKHGYVFGDGLKCSLNPLLRLD